MYHCNVIIYYLFVGGCVKQAADNMRARYVQSRHNICQDKWAPYQPKHYTTLALIHVEEHTKTNVISVTKDLVRKGKIEVKENENVIKCHNDDINYQNRSISEIFSNYLSTGRNLILIEGVPGVGKTVLSKEIAFQWAKNALLVHKVFVLLLVLRDRNLKAVNTLESLMEHIFRTESNTKTLVNYFLNTKGKDVTLILDGYDELSEEQRQNSFITDIIECKVLPECDVVITSRPTASENLHAKAQCRVEVLGFTEKDRLDYIHHAFEGMDDKIKAVQSYLESHSMINALCYIPLNMTILLHLFQSTTSQARLLDTQTRLYENFIKSTIRRFLKITTMLKFPEGADFSALHEPHNTVFQELSKLAYDGLTKDQIIFSMNEVAKACPHVTTNSDNCNGLGLIQAACYSDDCVSFNFIHFSIQEYMAAYYITSLPDKQQIKLLKNTFWNIHYFNTWIMYVGITKGESFAWKHFLTGNSFQLSTRILKSSGISKKLLQDKIKCLHLFQCFIEGSNECTEHLAKSVFENKMIDLSNQTLQPKDVNILGFFLLRTSKHWKKIDLSQCYIGEVSAKTLCKTFMDKSNRNMVKVDEVDLSNNRLQIETLLALLDVCKSWQTLDVIMCGNSSFPISKEIEYFDEIISNSEAIQRNVSVGKSLFGNKTTQDSILYNLLKLKHLNTLYLNDCIWKENKLPNTEFLAYQKLSTFHIIGKITNVCIRSIAEAVKQAECVFIYNHNLSDTEIDEIGEVLLGKAGTSDVKLAIGYSKMVGRLHTASLSTKLSSLEISHVFFNITNLCADTNQPLINYFKLSPSSRYVLDGVSLITSLQKNSNQCQISICLIEGDFFLAYRVTCKDIYERLQHYYELKSIFISHCELYRSYEFDQFVVSCRHQISLLNICILYSRFEGDLVEFICSKLLRKSSKGINMILHSVHPSFILPSKMIGCSYPRLDSVTLVTIDVILGYNITCDLFVLSLQLQSKVKSWKFWYCDLDFKFLNFINSVQAVETNHLTTLDFLCCNVVGTNQFHFLRNVQYFSSLMKITIKGSIKFHKIIKDAARFLMHNSSRLKELDISNLNLNLKNFKILAKSLKPFINLRKLSISGIGDVCEEDLALILSKNVEMEELDLSNLYNTDFTNIASSIKYKHLKKLNLSCNRLTPDIIENVLSKNTTLEDLNLSTLSLNFKDFMKIHFISSLKSLDISRNNGHSESSSASENISAAFVHITELEELNICDLSLDSDDLISIASKLCNMKNLRKLNIGKNRIDDKATQSIINLLHHNPNLEISDIYLRKVEDINAVTKLMINDPRPVFNKIHLCYEYGMYSIMTAFASSLMSPQNSKLEEILLYDSFKTATVSVTKFSKKLTKFSGKNDEIFIQLSLYIEAFLSNITVLENFTLQCQKGLINSMIYAFNSMKNISTLKKLKVKLQKSPENSIDEKKVPVLTQLLANNKHIKKVILSGFYLNSRSAVAIFTELKNFSDLITLDVSCNVITNKREHHGTVDMAVQCFASTLYYNPNLQQLDMHDMYLDLNETAMIFKSIQKFRSLIKLDVSENKVNVEYLGPVLSSCVNLQFIYLRCCTLSTTDGKVICDALKNNQHLKIFDISLNYSITGQEAGKAVGVVFSNNLNLTHCIMNGVGLQTSGMTKVVKSISNLNLQCIDFSNITFKDEVALNLAHAIFNCTKLNYLYLCNTKLSENSIVKIMQAIKNKPLNTIDISCNIITDEAANVIADTVKTLQDIYVLNLRKTKLFKGTAIKIAQSLAVVAYNRKIEYNILENIIFLEAIDTIKKVLPCATLRYTRGALPVGVSCVCHYLATIIRAV